MLPQQPMSRVPGQLQAAPPAMGSGLPQQGQMGQMGMQQMQAQALRGQRGQGQGMGMGGGRVQRDGFGNPYQNRGQGRMNGRPWQPLGGMGQRPQVGPSQPPMQSGGGVGIPQYPGGGPIVGPTPPGGGGFNSSEPGGSGFYDLNNPKNSQGLQRLPQNPTAPMQYQTR